MGGFTAADRGNVSKLLPDARSGVVPAGTRYITAELAFTRFAPNTNDGYADDLSLVLPEPSSPAAGELALAAVAGLALHAAPRARRPRPPRLR